MCIDACAWKKRFAPERSCCVCLDARGGGGAWERLVGSGQDTEDYKAKGREAAVANAMEWRARGKPHRHRLQRALERWHLASSVMKQGGGMRGVRKRGGGAYCWVHAGVCAIMRQRSVHPQPPPTRCWSSTSHTRRLSVARRDTPRRGCSAYPRLAARLRPGPGPWAGSPTRGTC